jgi:hypothetical protein
MLLQAPAVPQDTPDACGGTAGTACLVTAGAAAAHPRPNSMQLMLLPWLLWLLLQAVRLQVLLLLCVCWVPCCPRLLRAHTAVVLLLVLG